MRIRLLFVLLVAAILAACGGSKPTAVPAVSTQETLAAQPTIQPTPGGKDQPILRPTTPLDATRAPDGYRFGEVADRSSLDSYRAAYSWTWSELKDGVTQTGHWDALEEYSRADAAHRTVWGGTQGGVEAIQIGPYTYMKGKDGQWLALFTSDTNTLGLAALIGDPLDLISGSTGQLVQRGVSVNGVLADHYTLAEDSSAELMAFGVADSMTGEVYVWPELQTVVRYVAHLEGKALGISGGTNAVLDVTFDLTDINQPVEIVAPEGVKPPLAEDIPIIEGATDLNAMSGVVSYKTTLSVEEVTAFYRQAMPEYGWTAGQEVSGMLTFTKDSRQANLTVKADQGMTSVLIMATE